PSGHAPPRSRQARWRRSRGECRSSGSSGTGLRRNLCHLVVVKAADHLAIQHGGGTAGAKTKAIDGLESHGAVDGGFTEPDTQKLLQLFGHRFAAQSLAGFRAAKLQDVPAGRLLPVVVIEGDNAIHVRTRKV